MSSTLLRKKNRKNIFIYLVIKWNFRAIYVKTGYLIYKLFIWFLHYLGRISCLFMVKLFTWWVGGGGPIKTLKHQTKAIIINFTICLH